MTAGAGRHHDAVTSVERDLEVLGLAPRYYDWILAQLRPWIGTTVLECGAGSGHMTRRLIALGTTRVVASEVEAGYMPGLTALCEPAGAQVHALDLEALPADTAVWMQATGIDTVMMVNVLEHIVNDEVCIRGLAAGLPAGGRILIMVPAHQQLFSQLDRLYGHHRRYERANIEQLATRAGLRVRSLRSMNLPGALAWWLLHTKLGRTSLTPAGTRVFNLCVPVIGALEALIPPPFGQSLVAVLERP